MKFEFLLLKLFSNKNKNKNHSLSLCFVLTQQNQQQMSSTDNGGQQEEELRWVPHRKRQLSSLLRVTTQGPTKRVQKSNDDDADETRGGESEYTAGPRAKISLLDQVALELVKKPEVTEAELKLKEEKELMKAFDEFKPLVSVVEAAKGIEYKEAIRRSWRAPRHIENMPQERVEKIRSQFHILVSGDDVPPPVTRVVDLKIPAAIVDVLKASNIQRPTPIQMQGLPAILSGRDMIGVAFTGSGKLVARALVAFVRCSLCVRQTSTITTTEITNGATGKTLVFVLPMILLALEAELRLPLVEGEGPVGVVVCPSRELARQTYVLRWRCVFLCFSSSSLQ